MLQEKQYTKSKTANLVIGVTHIEELLQNYVSAKRIELELPTCQYFEENGKSFKT